jgi:hypothetical protein
MDFKCPYIMYDYVDRGWKVVTVDFLVPNQHHRFFWLSINIKKTLGLKIVVPPVFYCPTCIAGEHGLEEGFNQNTHKATAFHLRCMEIKKDLGVATNDEDADEYEVCAGTQCVQLPFECEDEFYRGGSSGEGYEILVLDNDDEKLYNELGEVSQFFILSVDMVHVEKEKVRVVGAMRKVKANCQFATGGGAKKEDEEEQEFEQMNNDS